MMNLEQVRGVACCAGTGVVVSDGVPVRRPCDCPIGQLVEAVWPLVDTVEEDWPDDEPDDVTLDVSLGQARAIRDAHAGLTRRWEK